jgi:Carbohydrate family 9 binding domain-like
MNTAFFRRLLLPIGIVCGALASFAPRSMPDDAVQKPLPRYTVQRTLGAITLDGQLNEESWHRAASTDAFRLANDSAMAQNQTSAKLLWDSTNLYVAFECADKNIIGRMTKRDANLWEEEVVEVFLCPDDPVLHGYTEIEISPANTLLDLFVRYTRDVNGLPAPVSLPHFTYNLDIRSAVQVRGTLNNEADKDTSWTMEIAIPLRDVVRAGRSSPENGEIWRMNLYRMERFPEREFIAWSPTGLSKFHVPKRFGELVFSMKSVGQ